MTVWVDESGCYYEGTFPLPPRRVEARLILGPGIRLDPDALVTVEVARG